MLGHEVIRDLNKPFAIGCALEIESYYALNLFDEMPMSEYHSHGSMNNDWNPHVDLQKMARAHRLGQTNKVMIYRLITRGTIEEQMMQMNKYKLALEHLVVGRSKAQNINQEELDDIIKYGSKQLFDDENDEA